ncbi:MAG: type II secretion system protein [Planctomycetota bacterium]
MNSGDRSVDPLFMEWRAHRHHEAAFTLTELIIVIITLAVLAAILGPRFAEAGTEASKAQLQSELALIDNQLELFRADHAGRYPHEVPAAMFLDPDIYDGWGVLVGSRYLLTTPRNPYLGGTILSEGSRENALETSSEHSWLFDRDMQSPYFGSIFAVGFDQFADTLAHESETEGH